ncbi:hypothetical protein [Methanococcoides sp. FTZ1]|uniref:hypothetical protein n=1 Tax=Methanococcoides sp. FTZ1 TaxID=3439061 RepID=UPI003F845EAE
MNKKLILLIILIVSLCACGCTDSPTYDSTSTQNSYQTSTQQQDYNSNKKIVEELEKHHNVLESDYDNLLSIVDQFEMNDDRIVRNNEVTLEDIYTLTNIIEEYNYEYRKVHSHLESHMVFLNRNQYELEELGVDVFTYKQSLNDYNIELQNTQDRMISRTEYYIDYLALQEEYNRQQKEDLEDLLNLLIMFA